MFFVIHGYSSPDHCQRDGNDAVLELTRCKSEEDVLKLYDPYPEMKEDPEYSNVTFVVVEGVERVIQPVERVTEYRLA